MPGFLFVLFMLLPVLSGVLWTPAQSPGARFNFEDGTASRILLLTAHPDDEAFFFGPTLTSFMPKAQVSTYTHHPEVYSLCISIGDADGIGAVRVEELGKSFDIFGIPAERRWVLDHTDLKDNIKAEWDPYLVADNVEKYVLSNNITTILTFDAFGVSAHPNHRSLFHAVSKLLSRPGLPTNLSAYGLITVPTSIKYLAILAPLQAKYDLLAAHLANQFYVPIPVFVAGAHEWKTTAKAIFSHQSQLVWFRWLNMAFSRYLWVNEWTAIRPTQ